MRKVTKEFEVYSLDEVREKALEKNRFINIDEGYDWDDLSILDWKQKLNDFGFEDTEIHFRGFNSQGDGACFDCKYFNIEKLLERVSLPENEKDFIKENRDCFELKIEKCGSWNLYCHKNTRYLDWNLVGDYAAFYWKNEYIEIMNRFINELEEVRLELCDEIYTDLEDEYDYLTSDKAVEDTLRVNEYEFNEDGTIF